MTPYTIETEHIDGDVPFITTIHLDKDNKAYGYGESAEESVQDAIYQLAFTLTLDDGDRYHGFKIGLLPEHLQQTMVDCLKQRNLQLQKRTVNITCLIGEWRNDSST